MPVQFIYKKFSIIWVVKNINNWFSIYTLDFKRKDRVYNATVAYTNSSFGQRFLNYLGPCFFRSMDSDCKSICLLPKNANKL